GSWPVVRITDGKARIVEFRSVLAWWDQHGDLLLRHMRESGQMWDQLLERREAEHAGAGDQISSISA
ncbi:MAG: hypothetical protein ACC634_03245, partial [Hyphomicrobiales bacterium]